MRLMVFAAALSGAVSLGGCNFLTPSGGAAERWATIENARAARANQTASVGKICKSMTPTGSIMPQRVCSTQAEWDAFDAETGQTAEAFNQLRKSGHPAPFTEGQQYSRGRE